LRRTFFPRSYSDFLFLPWANPNFTNGDFFILQQVVPPQIVIPSSLNLILFGLLLLFVLALLTVLRVSLRRSFGRALRLSED